MFLLLIMFEQQLALFTVFHKVATHLAFLSSSRRGQGWRRDVQWRASETWRTFCGTWV